MVPWRVRPPLEEEDEDGEEVAVGMPVVAKVV